MSKKPVRKAVGVEKIANFAPEMQKTDDKILSLWGLVALVFGPMIGAGIYNIAQNMAAGAGAGAVVVAWAITAVGMLTLVFTFKTLADARPDLDSGLYQYARLGFGRYAGFNMAWGYWLCAAFGNIAYAVMLNDAFGSFFPVFLDHGWPTVLFGTVLIWGMFTIVASGIKTASNINRIITALKFSSLIMVGILLVILFDIDLFASDFWGQIGPGDTLWTQIKSTMMVTLWCFLGIEGAAMMSARARRASDVGKAGVIGFFCAWTLYALISILCFGVMTRARLAGLHDPSVAYVLKDTCGDWAYYFVVMSVVMSLLGGAVAWFLICAQTAYTAAGAGIFPKRFLRLNRHGVPTYGLLIGCVVMQVFLLMVMMAESVYLAAINITSMMVLPAYLFSGLFLWKAGMNPSRYLYRNNQRRAMKCLILGIFCTIYCLWLIYSGGLDLLLLTSIFYLVGTPFYLRACREKATPGSSAEYFTPAERVAFAVIILATVASVYVMTR